MTSEKVGFYLRVSTNRQEAKAQRHKLREWEKYKDYKNAKWFTDMGKTGRNMKRQGFDQLLKDVKEGNIKVVVSFELSRITRNLADALKILALFVEYKVLIELPIKGAPRLDPSKSEQLRDIWIRLQAAEEESQRKSERAKAGAEQAKLNGSALGAPKGNRNKLGKYKEYPEHQLRQITEGIEKGLTYKQIGLELGRCEATIVRMVKYMRENPLAPQAKNLRPKLLPKTVKHIKLMRSKGHSIRQIAEILSLSKTQVHRILNESQI